jgi:tetratricopeptide (TPR) repeat protein
MIKRLCVLFFCLIAAFSLYAQAPLRTSHYEIHFTAGDESAAQSLSRELELRFDAYNSLFRFNPESLSSPLKARVFTGRDAYDAYVTARAGQTKDGAVYLHYNNKENRELVICRGSREESSALPHQAFIQFLRGFVSNPPSWLRDGMAIYFSGLRYDPASLSLGYEENLSFLESVKKLGENAPDIQALLEADSVPLKTIDDFQSCSWALASFFLSGYSADYYRTLVECFMILSPSASAADNGRSVLNRMEAWIDFDEFKTNYVSYLDSRRTYHELMEDGRKAYEAKDPARAESSFLSALDQRPSGYAPYYYLGLICYEEKNYALADEYYRKSLQRGAEEALVCYALGVNAAQAGKNAEAIQWLTQAAAADPDRYKSRAEELIQRMK